jgi:hypothetical protein
MLYTAGSAFTVRLAEASWYVGSCFHLSRINITTRLVVVIARSYVNHSVRQRVSLE